MFYQNPPETLPGPQLQSAGDPQYIAAVVSPSQTADLAMGMCGKQNRSVHVPSAGL